MSKLKTLKPRLGTLKAGNLRTVGGGSFSDPSRGSRHERGYGTSWDMLRLRILERDFHLCQCPECMGGQKRLTVATHVDHITPKAQGGTDDESNLRAVNADCHKRITLLQQGKRPRREIGPDGWPV